MAGIYIHVPFCTQRCYYCDFYSSVNTRLTNSFVNSLLQETEQKKSFFAEPLAIRTIYFGGGTPSLLTIQQLESILDKLSRTFYIAINVEITCEVNPDDLSPEFLKALRKIGINRLSMGIQSFDPVQLKIMNRRHNAKQAEDSVKMAVEAGFRNLSIDLIYALPHLNQELWQQTLEKAFSLPVQHISAYHLGIEEGTVFGNWLKKGKIQERNEDESWLQFKMLHDFASLKGFDHYEISNLSLPEYRSKHNTSYWNNVPYLGLGPSAHSFNGIQRFWNVADINKYINSVENNHVFTQSETLTIENRLHETIMTRLRTKEGIQLSNFEEQFGLEDRKKLESFFAQLIENQLATQQNDWISLTLKGWFISDRIILEIISAF